jgi:hypothetical protein
LFLLLRYDDIPVDATGENCPTSINAFAEIDLGACVRENIRLAGWEKINNDLIIRIIVMIDMMLVIVRIGFIIIWVIYFLNCLSNENNREKKGRLRKW